MDVFPSKTAILDRESFLNKIVRKAESQIEEEQIEPNKPNIIMIKAIHWLVFISECECLTELKKKMIDFFSETKEQYLSGVAIFGNDFERTIFIENPSVAETSKLEKEDIEKLGFQWIVSS